MKMNSRSFWMVLLLPLLALSTSAEAAKTEAVSSKKFRAGMNLGLGVPTSDTFGTSRLLLGVDLYVVHDSKIDLGLSYTTGSSDVVGRRRYRASFFGGELNYKMPQVSPGFYVGASAGLTRAAVDDFFFPGFDDLYFGPKAGFWHMISPDFSLGFEGKMLLVTSDPIFAWLDFLGAIRVHF